MQEDTPRRPLWRKITGSVWFHLVASFVVVGLILSFVAKPYVVPSGSMEQTLQIGDRVLVNRLAYLGSDPHTGDVIVFDADAAWDGEVTRNDNPIKAALRWVGEVTGFGPSGAHTLVKRAIGTPGDIVECCDAEGDVVVNGESLDEPYVYDDFAFTPGVLDCTTTPRSARCFDAVTVPDDAYLMLGDHRSASSDSAAACRAEGSLASCWRWASRDAVVGSAGVILWPIGRWGSVG